MKRILIFLLVVGALSAYGQCDHAFDKACNLYKNGKYKDAKMQFEWCCTHCKNHSESTYRGWIDKCDAAQKKQAVAYQKRRKAETEAVAQQQKEALERKERVEHNRFIYLSVSSAVQGKFSNLEYELEDSLYTRNPTFKFTRDSLEAYWFVRVAVNTYGHPSGNRCYYVDATVEVENAATQQENRSRAVDKGCCPVASFAEEQAMESVANEIYSTGELLGSVARSIAKFINQ